MERKFYFRLLLILVQETRPGCQGIFHNIGIITHLISHGTFQRRTGSLHHWCVESVACSGDIWPHASHSFILLTFIDMGLWNVSSLQPWNQRLHLVSMSKYIFELENHELLPFLDSFFQHKKFKSVALWGIWHCCCQNKCCIIPFQDIYWADILFFFFLFEKW